MNSVDRLNRINEVLSIICITSCITMVLTAATCFAIVVSINK